MTHFGRIFPLPAGSERSPGQEGARPTEGRECGLDLLGPGREARGPGHLLGGQGFPGGGRSRRVLPWLLGAQACVPTQPLPPPSSGPGPPSSPRCTSCLFIGPTSCPSLLRPGTPVPSALPLGAGRSAAGSLPPFVAPCPLHLRPSWHRRGQGSGREGALYSLFGLSPSASASRKPSSWLWCWTVSWDPS